MSQIKQINKSAWALHLDNGEVYTISNSWHERHDNAVWRLSNTDWEQFPMTAGGFKIIPYGWDNLLPIHLRDILESNNLAPGVLRRQMGLIFGQGLHLYREVVTTRGEIVKNWTEDAGVQNWLESWDYVKYVERALMDYLHTNGCVSLLPLKRGSRLTGKAFIACLENVPIKDARLEWTESGTADDVKRIIVGDFEHQCPSGVREYPVFNPKAPAAARISAMYSNTGTFGRSFYSLPQYWGTLRWIVRGSDIPSIFKYVTDNSLNMAYHIHSPQSYWNTKREFIRLLNPDYTDAQVEEKIAEMTKNFLQNLTKVLSGKENAGKFFHTVDIPDDSGALQSWKIEPIDQKIKEFVEAQLKINDASVSAITSGMGLYPALSNISMQGKLSSGSDLMNAFQLARLVDVEIPSNTVLKALNQAIAVNFPDKKLKIGFYYTKLGTQSEISPDDRLINQ